MITQALAADETGQAAGLPMTWCGTKRTTDDALNAVSPSSVPQVKVIYAYASDRPDRFEQLKDKLQANVSLLSRYVAQQSGARKTVRFDMGTDCGAQYVDIQTVALPNPRAHYLSGTTGSYFTNLKADVRNIVTSQYPGQAVDWMVYADDMRGTVAAGTGEIYGSADLANTTLHNQGRLVSAVWGTATVPGTSHASVATMLHEITHNLGGVQLSAPHTTGALHCNDEHDVMCYADGGPTDDMTDTCPKTNTVDGFPDTYDCGGDDYFNPTPAPGSYLDTHWNVYDSAFLGPCADELLVACGTDGEPPLPPGPQNTTPDAATGWRAGDYSVQLAGNDPAGITRYEWYVAGSSDGVQTSRTARVTGEGTFTLAHRVGSATAWSQWRQETIRIDRTAPTLFVSCAPSPGSTHRCTVVATDVSPVRMTYAIGKGAAQSLPVGPLTVPDGATLTVTATDAVGRRSTKTTAMPGAGGGTSTPDRGWTRTLRLRRGGRTLATATAHARAAGGTLRLPAVKVGAGRYELRMCAPGVRCRTYKQTLRRVAKLKARSFAFKARSGRITVRLTVRRGRRNATVASGNLTLPLADENLVVA